MNRLADIDWSKWRAKDPATLVFVFRGDQVLLIDKKTGLGKGKVNAPGGKVDPGETPEAAAVRECREELHISVRNLEFCGEHCFQFVDGYSIHVYVYRTRDFDGVPTETREAAPRWTPVEEIPFDEMWEDDRYWLPMVLSGERFLGRWIFDGDTMVDYQIETGGQNTSWAGVTQS
jgi:8-oxo-dGTP diphosphatase